MENFSPQWDETYKAGLHASIWPWSDLVAYVYRYSRPNKEHFKVLEVGAGAGANVSFFKALGMEYYAVEGSATAVDTLRKKFPEFKDTIVQGDFTVEIPFDEIFDLVVDRAALTHNTTQGVKNGINLITEKLKSGGIFIGIDWFSTEHEDYKNEGREAEDKYTKTDFENGQFIGLGRVHFSDKKHIEELFSDYNILAMEHKIVTTAIPDTDHTFASWNFAVSKKM